MIRFSSLLTGVCIAGMIAMTANAESTTPDGAVSYSREILPILQQNCVACHRAKQAEGGLSLETVKALLVGGDSGVLWESTDPAASLLYTRLTDDNDPMPPDENTVGAKRLTENQLTRIRHWIAQGATIDQHSGADIDWQPVPETIRSSYSLAVSPDDQTVAVGHANRIELLNSRTGKVADTLVDEQLSQSGVADVDVIQAIAFSPLGDLIATGGYRTVRIWQRQPITAEVPPALQRASGPVAFNPDHKAVAIVNAIGDVEVWDLESGEKRISVPASTSVADMAWGHQDSFVIGYETGDLAIHAATDGSPTAVLQLDHSIASVAQSPDGHTIASLGTEGQIRLFESQQPKPITSLNAVKDATSIVFTSKNQLVVGSATGIATVIDHATDKALHQFNHESPIVAIATSHTNNRIATGGSDGQSKVWNLDDGNLLTTLSGDRKSRLRIQSLDDDLQREEAWLQTLEKQSEVLKKSLETEDAALAKVKEARENASKALAEKTKLRDETAKQIAATKVKIAEAKSQIEQANQTATKTEGLIATNKTQLEKTTAELQLLEKQAAMTTEEPAAAELANRVAEKKTQLLAEQKANTQSTEQLAAAKKLAAEANAKVTAETAALEKQNAALVAAENEVQAKQADLAERDQALVTTTKTRELASLKIPEHQNIIRLRKNELGELKYRRTQLTTNGAHWPSVTSITFSPDDLSIAVVDAKGGVRTFDGQTGGPLDRDQLSDSRSAAFSSGAQWIDGDRLVVHDPFGPPQVIALQHRWRLIRSIGGIDSELIADRVTALDFRGDGESIAIGSGTPSRDGQVIIVATATGEVLRRFDNVHSDSVLAVRFSPDDRVLATASADKTIRLLDVQSEEILGALDGHTHHVLSISWKNDGRILASGSADQTIKTWDVGTMQRIRTIGGFPDEVTSIAFIGDGTRVVSSTANGQVRVHESSTGAQVSASAAPGDFLFATGTTADGTRVFSAGQKGSVNVWETEGLKSIGTW